MSRSQINGNFIDKTFSIVANILLHIILTTSCEKEAFAYYRDGPTRENRPLHGDFEIVEAWFDQVAKYRKQAIAYSW